MKCLVYVETHEGKAQGGSLELLTAASNLGEAVAVVLGSREAADQVAAYGVNVLLAGEACCADAATAMLESIIREQNPQVVLMNATLAAKDLAPRLAHRLGGGCVTDAVAVEADEAHGVVFTRPAYGGTVLERLALTSAAPAFATVRSGSFAKPEQTGNGTVIEVAPAVAEDAIRARLVETVTEITEMVNLEGADIVVCGGRGMGDAQGFKLVEELAEVLGGVVGATRPVIEEGWISRAHQIGQSGKMVAPKLYIACGVSGAMQHISGAMASKYIVAINKDEAASIFDVADVGIVGDVHEILPLMIEEIRKRKA